VRPGRGPFAAGGLPSPNPGTAVTAPLTAAVPSGPARSRPHRQLLPRASRRADGRPGRRAVQRPARVVDRADLPGAGTQAAGQPLSPPRSCRAVRDGRRARGNSSIAVTTRSARGPGRPPTSPDRLPPFRHARPNCLTSCAASGPRRPGPRCHSRAGHTASWHAADPSQTPPPDTRWSRDAPQRGMTGCFVRPLDGFGPMAQNAPTISGRRSWLCLSSSTRPSVGGQ